MGSPKDEPERSDTEGPQHTVRLRQGYWLFDTPVTQALWQAVMGTDNNPSRFTDDPQHPVERVNWHDSKKFIATLNRIKPSLELTLPSEAQWEYACRAGSETAIYAEELDAIAWYSDNSSRTTHPVGKKQSNAWGLYDMLGNVWEWCLDGRRTYHSTNETDPLGSTEAGALRVMRGGSWSSEARICRSAARVWLPPDYDWDLLGFRCARVQE